MNDEWRDRRGEAKGCGVGLTQHLARRNYFKALHFVKYRNAS
jgi:hypothetical protein